MALSFHSYLKSFVPAPSPLTLKTHIHTCILKISTPGHRIRFVIRNKYTMPLPPSYIHKAHVYFKALRKKPSMALTGLSTESFYLLRNHLIS